MEHITASGDKEFSKDTLVLSNILRQVHQMNAQAICVQEQHERAMLNQENVCEYVGRLKDEASELQNTCESLLSRLSAKPPDEKINSPVPATEIQKEEEVRTVVLDWVEDNVSLDVAEEVYEAVVDPPVPLSKLSRQERIEKRKLEIEVIFLFMLEKERGCKACRG